MYYLECCVLIFVIDEVVRRMLGFVVWQQLYWVGYCGDVCVFMGEVMVVELDGVLGVVVDEFLKDNGLEFGMWEDIK